MGTTITKLPTAGTVTVKFPLVSDGTSEPLLSLSSPVFVVPNQTQPRILGSGLAAGQNDLYTVPPGRRLMVEGIAIVQTSGSTGTATLQVKIGGTYYSILTPLTPGGLSAQNAITIILEAGQTLSLLTTTTTVNAVASAFEYDAAGSNLKGIIVAGTAAGTPTAYTVPAGKSACILGNNFATYGSVVLVINDIAANTFTLYQVPNGQTADTAHKILVSAALTASSKTSLLPFANLLELDTLAYSASTPSAATVIYLSVLELSNS